MKQLLSVIFGKNIFQFFKDGCKLKNISNSSIELRNSTDTNYANISVAEPSSNSHCATKFYVDNNVEPPDITTVLTEKDNIITIQDLPNKQIFTGDIRNIAGCSWMATKLY